MFDGTPEWTEHGEDQERTGELDAAATSSSPTRQEAGEELDHGSDDRPGAGMVADEAHDASPDEAPSNVDGGRRGALPHRAQMERLFGTDLGEVSVRTRADLSDLDADGAAQGDQVAFASAHPKPSLVAHEVAHVLQQRQGGTTALAASRRIAAEDSPAEREAENVAAHVEHGGSTPVAVNAPPGGGIHLKRSKPYFAKTGPYNKKAVKSNKKHNENQLARAGVRVGERDKWKLDGGSAQRFKITSHPEVALADTIDDERDIAINPSKPRLLNIPGMGMTSCIYVWARGRGAAWLPLSKLAATPELEARVLASIRARVEDWAPSKHAGPTTPYHFATGGSSRATAQDESSHVRPNQRTKADRIPDYLEKTVADGMGGQRTFFNVCMNLPQDDAAPIATDHAAPNERFLVANGSEFRRTIGIFAKRSSTARARQVWVFGYLSKQEGPNLVPDLSRRGWVPLRVLRRG